MKRADRKRADRKRIHRKRYYRGSRKKIQHRKRSIVSNIILAIAILVFLYAAVMLVRSLLPYYQGKSGYRKIQDIAIKVPEKGKDSEKKPEKFSVNFDKLLKLNPDTVGWIRFDEPSIINYPIVQGKDNSQYLTQSFTEDDNKLGTIFVNVDNSGDFTDKQTIIYGHNMHYGGDMFTKLVKYEKVSFCKKHPYFYIYTPDGKVSTYQVYAVADIQDTSEFYNVSFEDDAAFEKRIADIRSDSLYNVEVDVTKDDQVVMLSTCTNYAQDERFVVHGVKIKEEEFAAE